MAHPNVDVRLNRAGIGTVLINGEPLGGVRAVTIKAEVGCLPVVLLELVAGSVDFEQGVIAEGVPDAAPDR